MGTDKKKQRDIQDVNKVRSQSLNGEETRSFRKKRDSVRESRNKKYQIKSSTNRRSRKQQPIRANQVLKKVATIGEFLIFLCIVLLFLWGLFNLGNHRVSGVSMAPALTDGDRVIIRKTQSPKRNDIVTFVSDEKSGENLIKRVAGLPGDEFFVDGDSLYLFPSGSEFDKTSDLVYSGNLPDSTIILLLTEEAIKKFEGLNKIPEGCYFVVGDNRRESTDSRYFGFIKKEQIEGVLAWRILPLRHFGFVH